MRSISLGIDEDTDLDAPDDASDLWERTPGRRGVCPACALIAERFYGHFCWLCFATGDAGRKLAHPTTTEYERDLWSGLLDDVKAGRSRREPGAKPIEQPSRPDTG